MDERLEVTGAPTWADSVSTGSRLFDALLDPCENEAGEDGLVGALAEDRADNRACNVACEMILEEALYLGNRIGPSHRGLNSLRLVSAPKNRLKMDLGSRMLRHSGSH